MPLVDGDARSVRCPEGRWVVRHARDTRATAFDWMNADAHGALHTEAPRRARFYAQRCAAAFEMVGRTRGDPGMNTLAETCRRPLCGA